MFSRLLFIASVSLLLLPFAAASPTVEVIEPVIKNLTASSPDVLDLGLVGPGQKVEIVVSNGTGEISKNGSTLSRVEANWNILKVDPASLPAGWKGEDSGEYESPLKAHVIAAKNAPDGVYTFTFHAINRYEGFDVAVPAKATVSRSVFTFRMASDPVKVRARETASYVFTLTNTGNANDEFELIATGIPGAPARGVQVFVPHASSVTATYPVNVQELGAYPIEFKATSLSSEEISGSAHATLFVGSDLLTDARAAARGVLLFPTGETAVYALWSLIGSLLG